MKSQSERFSLGLVVVCLFLGSLAVFLGFLPSDQQVAAKAVPTAPTPKPYPTVLPAETTVSKPGNLLSDMMEALGER